MTTNAALSVDPANARVPVTPRDADGCYRYRLYVDGAFVDPLGAEWLDSTEIGRAHV